MIRDKSKVTGLGQAVTVITGLLLLFLSSVVSASVIDLGTLDEDHLSLSEFEWTGWGGFEHNFSFDVDVSVAEHIIEGGVKEKSLIIWKWEIFDIEDLEYFLYDDAAKTNKIASGGSGEWFSEHLGAGTFFLDVTGSADGILGGLYKLKIKVTNAVVPLPSTTISFDRIYRLFLVTKENMF